MAVAAVTKAGDVKSPVDSIVSPPVDQSAKAIPAQPEPCGHVLLAAVVVVVNVMLANAILLAAIHQLQPSRAFPLLQDEHPLPQVFSAAPFYLENLLVHR